MRTISMTVQVKTGRVYNTNRVVTDPSEIYEKLAKDLLHKKIHKCTYISKISERSNYDGTRTITVTYDNGVRTIYVIND
jgi:hypothetical protein